MRVFLDERLNTPTQLVGCGDIVAPTTAVTSVPWKMAVATSMVSAATGWMINEVALRVRGRGR